MTAFVLKPYHDRVEILTDGAYYSPDGMLLSTAYKVHLAHDAPLAIVGSGSVVEIKQAADVILALADATGSVDETLKSLSNALAPVADSPSRDTGFRIGIAAISETAGPICLHFSSFDDGNVSAFELVYAPTGFGQGSMPDADTMVANVAHLQGTKDGLAADGPWLFEQMRQKKNVNPASPDLEPIYSVGGHLDLTIVRKNEYEHQRLLTWPDVVGEPIDPFATGRFCLAVG
jgi:hypothetical protein